MSLVILLTLFKYWAATEPVMIDEVEVPLAELNPAGESPGPGQAAIAMRKVLIEFNAKGKVSAASGDDKLGAFDPGQVGKLKPLADWLAKVGKKEELAVVVRVHKDTKMEGVIELLNVFTNQGITQISIADLNDE